MTVGPQGTPGGLSGARPAIGVGPLLPEDSAHVPVDERVGSRHSDNQETRDRARFVRRNRSWQVAESGGEGAGFGSTATCGDRQRLRPCAGGPEVPRSNLGAPITEAIRETSLRNFRAATPLGPLHRAWGMPYHGWRFDQPKEGTGDRSVSRVLPADGRLGDRRRGVSRRRQRDLTRAIRS